MSFNCCPRRRPTLPPSLSPFLPPPHYVCCCFSAAAARSFCFNSSSSSSVSYSFVLFVSFAGVLHCPRELLLFSFVHCHWRYYVDGGHPPRYSVLCRWWMRWSSALLPIAQPTPSPLLTTIPVLLAQSTHGGCIHYVFCVCVCVYSCGAFVLSLLSLPL